jgi:CRP-like cAMP-binding protein
VDFVDRIAALALRAAIETLESAFDPRRMSVMTLWPERPPRRRRDKRTAAELAQLSASLLTFVQQNPGLRVEQINHRLGTTRATLALPLRRLIANGVLHTKGRKRSTKYYPAEVGHPQPVVLLADEHAIGRPEHEASAPCSA